METRQILPTTELDGFEKVCTFYVDWCLRLVQFCGEYMNYGM